MDSRGSEESIPFLNSFEAIEGPAPFEHQIFENLLLVIEEQVELRKS